MKKAKSIVASLELFDQLSIIIDHRPTTTSGENHLYGFSMSVSGDCPLYILKVKFVFLRKRLKSPDLRQSQSRLKKTSANHKNAHG